MFVCVCVRARFHIIFCLVIISGPVINLSYLVDYQGGIDLKWNSTFPNITSYRVTVAKDGQIFLKINTTNNSIDLPNVIPAHGWKRTNYTVAVRALISSIASDPFILVLDLSASEHNIICPVCVYKLIKLAS